MFLLIFSVYTLTMLKDIGEFRQVFKDADIIPVHKKKEKSDKTNYRPISKLLNASKIYEKLIYNQLCGYFANIHLPSECGFRKGYSSQHCLLALPASNARELSKICGRWKRIWGIIN